MTPSASLLTFTLSTGLAGLALAQLRTVVGLAGPVDASAHPDRGLMVQPGPRAVVHRLCAYPLPIQVGHAWLLSVEDPSTMESSLAADSLCSETDNDQRS